MVRPTPADLNATRATARQTVVTAAIPSPVPGLRPVGRIGRNGPSAPSTRVGRSHRIANSREKIRADRGRSVRAETSDRPVRRAGRPRRARVAVAPNVRRTVLIGPIGARPVASRMIVRPMDGRMIDRRPDGPTVRGPRLLDRNATMPAAAPTARPAPTVPMDLAGTGFGRADRTGIVGAEVNAGPSIARRPAEPERILAARRPVTAAATPVMSARATHRARTSADPMVLGRRRGTVERRVLPIVGRLSERIAAAVLLTTNAPRNVDPGTTAVGSDARTGRARIDPTVDPVAMWDRNGLRTGRRRSARPIGMSKGGRTDPRVTPTAPTVIGRPRTGRAAIGRTAIDPRVRPVAHSIVTLVATARSNVLLGLMGARAGTAAIRPVADSAAGRSDGTGPPPSVTGLIEPVLGVLIARAAVLSATGSPERPTAMSIGPERAPARRRRSRTSEPT